MKGFKKWILLALVLFAYSCDKREPIDFISPYPKHIFLIGLDGLGSLCNWDRNTINWEFIKSNSIYTFSNKSVFPSVSACNWT